MARGVTQDRVNNAADALLQRGERPTIEKVRAELGTGSPNTLMRLIEVWWMGLAERLAAQARANLPGIPEPVQRAMMTLWSEAVVASRAEASASTSAAREALDQEKVSLAAERSRWSADLDAMRTAAKAADEARGVAEQRLADHQRLVDQLRSESQDLMAQRDKGQQRADVMARDMMYLASKLEKQDKSIAEERLSMAAHVRSVEDRAHAEVDRVREEAKAMRNGLTQLERTSQTARDAAAREHKEHVAQLRTVEREASAQRARADALENQLKRLTQIAGKPRAPVSPRRTQKKVRSPRGTAN
jgi:hypothetical protein